VKLDVAHPDYPKSYLELQEMIRVHGNLTYGDQHGTFGFDCHHTLLGDVSPVDETMATDSRCGFLFHDSTAITPHYWTFDEVRAEVESMAAQFAARR
jgi:hypothetical protein